MEIQKNPTQPTISYLNISSSTNLYVPDSNASSPKEDNEEKKSPMGRNASNYSKLNFKERMTLMKALRDSKDGKYHAFSQLEQPLYVFNKDQEPLNFNRKLYVRLFKRSRKTQQEFEREVLGVNHSTCDSKHNNKQQKQMEDYVKELNDKRNASIINDLIYMDKGNGDLEYSPRKDANALKYMNIALTEIEKTENGTQKKLSSIQKNRLALKFVEMNASPQKYEYYERFTDENIKQVRLNLKQQDLKRFKKLREMQEKQKLQVKLRHQSQLSPNQSIQVIQEQETEEEDKEKYENYLGGTIVVDKDKLNTSLEISIFNELLNNKSRTKAQKAMTLKSNVKQQISSWKRKKDSSVNRSNQDSQIINDQSGVFSQIHVSPLDGKYFQSQDNSAPVSAQRNLTQVAVDNANISIDFIKFHNKPIITDSSTQYLPLINQNSKYGGFQSATNKDNESKKFHFNINNRNNILLSNQTSKNTLIISERNQKELDKIKDPMLKIKRSVERFGKNVDGMLSHSLNSTYIQRHKDKSLSKLNEEQRINKYEQKFDQALDKLNQIHDNKNIEKTSIQEFSEKIRQLMIRKRQRKYGNLGQL
ncbi:UNKNOWN [Stylonychia lemnae]|uniref:Uncharacterized protein n=1 Tax=Stylonychia lemnae TaxID=5949 RepID=A0A078AA74_STYLE|nr:UNKNOWN [Stylonychia lemnae]|eukprot:CDW77718.1 UNKNOWN [Stylonychia lemnae]